MNNIGKDTDNKMALNDTNNFQVHAAELCGSKQTFTKWVSFWGNAMSIGENHPERYGKNLTLSYPVICPFDGDAIRFTFDNYCGTEDVTITRASFLLGDEFYDLTFGGMASGTMAAGKRMVSDETAVHITAGDTLQVRFYCEGYTLLRSCVVAMGPLSKGTYAVGDMTHTKAIPIEVSRSTDKFYFLSNISVRTGEENRAIVCYGDSITAQNWPDELALRCKELGASHTSIVRRATSGSRILREYSCITYESYGLKGEKRFAYEVPTDGADTVIIQQGINDIIHPVGTEVNPFRPMSDLPTVEELVSGLKEYIRLGKEMGYKVYVGTLLPIEGWRTYAAFRDELRCAYNEAIRKMADAGEIDGCIDFDLAVRDPKRPSAFLPENDSGDHLHPGKLGYKRMAEDVPADILY